MLSVAWKAPNRDENRFDSPVIAPVALFSATWDSISQWLDLHDLMLLFQTGSSFMQRLILDHTRCITIGSPSYSVEELNGLCLPPKTLSLVSAFKQLSHLYIFGANLIIRDITTSPLLEFPATLRHLTLELFMDSPAVWTVLSDLPWSMQFPLLETLYLTCPTRSPKNGSTEPRRFEAFDSLPPTLTSLTLVSNLFGSSNEHLKLFLIPIGLDVSYPEKEQHPPNTWNQYWSRYSPEQRLSFRYRLPNLRFINLSSFESIPEDWEPILVPDLAILPPQLQTLIIHFPWKPLRSEWLQLPLVELAVPQRDSSTPCDSTAHFSLATLFLGCDYPRSLMNTLPPSLTRLGAPKMRYEELGMILPNLRHLDISSDQDTTKALNNSESGRLLESIKLRGRGFERADVLDLSVAHQFHRPRVIDFSPHTRRVELHGRLMLPPSSRGAPGETSHFSSLQTLILRLDFIEDRLLPKLPRNITKLHLQGHPAASAQRLELDGLPPSLAHLFIGFMSIQRFLYLDSRALALLPRTLAWLDLPFIFPYPYLPHGLFPAAENPSIGETSALPPSPEMLEEGVRNALALIPAQCTCYLKFCNGVDPDTSRPVLIPPKLVNQAMDGTGILATTWKTRWTD